MAKADGIATAEARRSRQNPSPRYFELLAIYREMHLTGDRFVGAAPEHTFSGRSLYPQIARIKRLVASTGARTILDYGSGKGRQYDPRPLQIEGKNTWYGIIDDWGVDEVHCFDPAYPPYSALPSGRFEGVIATDVLEHCPEEDIPWIVEEVFSFATRFVFATIACYPARKLLPNGENAHCTQRPPNWWEAVLRQAAAARPGVIWEAWVQLRRVESPERAQGSEIRIAS